MILIIDNYDSFVYNLVQYVGEHDEAVVRRNDELGIDDVAALDPDGIVVSPGPGRPEDAGIIVELFRRWDGPILGVCLGHQALCAAHDSPVGHAPTVVHGKPSIIRHDGRGMFAGLPARLQVGRYHSLAVDRADLADSLHETAWTVEEERSIVMGVRHESRPHIGVQFHPESILTGPADGTDHRDLTVGRQMIATFCEMAGRYRA
ncbi:MAG: anthranilate synthase component II [Halobacteriota archaeon]